MDMLTNLQNQSPYAIGWGTLALVNAGLAQSKNRSGLCWFLISLLLGPIATFFVVIIEPVLARSKPTQSHNLAQLDGALPK
jgi:hypothetical protein